MSHIKTVFMGACAAAILCACATPQSNPHYKYSSKMPADTSASGAYQSAPAQAPVTYQAAHTVETYSQPAYVQSASYLQPVAYQSPQTRQACLVKEQNRKIAGAAIGGAIGAYAGKKLGGDDNDTLGMVGGAAIGGIAGYGAGDMTTDCDPVAAAPISAHNAAGYPASPVASPLPAQAQAVTTATRYEAPVMIETGGPLSQEEMQYDYNNGGYVTAPQTTQAAVTAPAPAVTQRLYDAPAVAAAPMTVSAPAGVTYIVQEGDTAWNLSRKTCSSITDIKAMNNLEGDFLIKAGEAILLPASKC